MSQAGIIDITASILPPTVPLVFHTDSGDATPAANAITFTGVGGTFSGSGSTVTFTTAENTITATATTTDATPTPLGPAVAVPTNGSVSVIVNLVAYDVTASKAAGGQILATLRNVLGTASLCGSADVTKNSDASLVGLIFTVIPVSGNFIVLVTGNGDTIHWKANISIVSVT